MITTLTCLRLLHVNRSFYFVAAAVLFNDKLLFARLNEIAIRRRLIALSPSNNLFEILKFIM